MNPHFKPVLALSLLPLTFTSLTASAATEESDVEVVYAYGETGKTDTATKLNLTVRETPQNITTMSLGQIEDFNLTKVNKALDYAPGVTVEEIETNRTYYTARGFDIVNFQYDGVGAPFVSGINLGQQDTATYEKIEVIKGAAGLITGVANPSATVNYVRKRPTEEFQGSAALTLGQWNNRRLEGDVSGSLSDSVRGRAVVVADQGDSYLDRYSDNTKLGYGIIEADLTDSTQLSLGYKVDKNQSDGVLWGALPLVYSDGSRTDYDVSTSTATDWTFANTTQKQAFVELNQDINYDWSAHLVFTRSQYDYESELFYVYGTPNADTEVGLYGYASAYDRKEVQRNLEAYLSGNLMIGEQEHQIVAGISNTTITVDEASYYNYTDGYPVLGGDWMDGNTPAMDFPDHNPATGTTDLEITMRSVYLATRWNLSDSLSILAGARTNDIEQKGVSYGGDADTDANKTTPYLGATYDLTEDTTLYGSYSEVFKQQTFVNAELRPLGAVEGDATEFGVKHSLNDGLASISAGVFSSSQSNFGVFVGRNDAGIALYEPAELDSQGFEIELAGEVADNLNLSAGFSSFEITDKDGEKARTFLPTKTLDISGSYALPAIEGLKIGAVLSWQNAIKTEGSYTNTDGQAATTTIKQDAYALLDLSAQYQATEALGFSVNVENVTDKKYLNSLYWTQAYYGAPRNISAGVRWDF